MIFWKIVFGCATFLIALYIMGVFPTVALVVSSTIIVGLFLFFRNET